MEDYLTKGKQILKQIKRNGYEAYFVGGFVRDRLLGIESKDIDITTSATPEEVISLFNNVKETGKKFGSVTVLADEFRFEVTTFRSDGEYKDNRRPETVSFSKNVKDDILRRDFTINSFLMDEDENIIDLLDAKSDLENKIIRTINNPVERFNEDALRMLRAFRFVSKLGFDIEENTLHAIANLSASIKDIAIERTMIELSKTFAGKFRNKALKYMIESKTSENLFGLEDGIKYISNLDVELYPLEAFIVCFVIGDIDDKWKFSNKENNIIEKILILHEVTKEDIFNKFIVYVNKLDLCLLANKINTVFGYKDQEALIRKIYDELPIHDVCDLKFKGQDILWLTELRKKSWIGRIVDDLKYNVIMGYLPNDYEILKEYALKKVDELVIEMGDNNE
jgi:tRNA nucleotidyltransferase (CCA-adding enzyme)